MIRHDMLYSVAKLKKVILAADRFQNNFNFDCNTVIAERVTKDYGRTAIAYLLRIFPEIFRRINY